MMDYDNQSFEEAHLYASKEDMESLALDDNDVVRPRPPLSAVEIPTNDDSDGRDHHNGNNIHDPLLSSPSSITQHPQNQTGSQNPSSNSYFLEPPSYADAVFRSFDASSEINGHDLSTSSPALSPSPTFSDYIIISVSDPQKEMEVSNSLVPGGNTYFSYLITTRTNFSEFTGTEFSVRRRFRDVVTLADRLAEVYRGFFIPIRPDKSVVESQVMQKQGFVDQRRVALEKYLRKLAKHPVIGKSEELRFLLESQGKLPLTKTTDVASRMLDGAVKLPKQLFGGEVVGGVVDVNEMAQPAKGGRDLLRIFKELKQSVTNEWGGTKPPLAEEDKEFVDRKEKLQDLEQHLSNVSQQAEELVKAQQDIGETMGQLGLALVKLTKFETEEAVYDSQRTRAADMKNVATAAVKASRLYRELNAQSVKHLDQLHEYIGVMLAVNNAFSDRSSALLTVQTLLSELSSLNSRIEKLEAASPKMFGGDRTRFRKIEELKETVRITEDAKNYAIGEYQQIKVGYTEKMASVWESVAEETSRYAKGSS